MKPIINRRNRMFVIDKSQLKPEAQKNHIMNALYAAVYAEFKGASENPDYRNLTLLDRMKALNAFAENWLKERGLH